MQLTGHCVKVLTRFVFHSRRPTNSYSDGSRVFGRLPLMISGLIREAICVTLSPHLTPPPALLVMHRPPLWKSEGSFGLRGSDDRPPPACYKWGRRSRIVG